MIGNKIKSLGEIILRVNDIKLMTDFYQNSLGLELIKDVDNYKFFKIAEGYGGHYQVLAVFAKTNPNAFDEVLGSIDSNNSSLHHYALEIDKNDYNYIIKQLKNQHIVFKTEVFEWVKWKSIFIKDPEENIIEFVCYDNDIQ